MGQVISIATRSFKFVTRPTRARLPPDIELSIANWRLAECWQPIPADYREWHFHLAGEELDRIAEKYRLEVVNDPRFVSDNFARAFVVEVLTFRQKRITLEWCDDVQAFLRRTITQTHIQLDSLRECDLV